MDRDIKSILYTADEIQTRVAELGARITKDFEGKNPLFVGILKGSFVFMADLMRHVNTTCAMDFMAVSSYGNETVSTGAVIINKDLGENIENRHVILVEDILDSGATLNYLVSYLGGMKPASISIAILLDKPSHRSKPVEPDYVGFEVPDEFVVGYGLDYAEKYRNLPYIGVLKPEIYSG